MVGNIPGGNFPGGNLIGGNFPGGSFPDTEENICKEFSSDTDLCQKNLRSPNPQPPCLALHQ